MKLVSMLAIAKLASALAGSPGTLGADPVTPTQPMDAEILQMLKTDLARADDGGVKARAAAEQAVKAGRPDLLVVGLTNRLYDVRTHSVKVLQRCPLFDQVTVLAPVLTDSKAWVREEKVGELIAGQERFLSDLRALIQRIVEQPPAKVDLLDPQARQRVAKELLKVRADRLRAQAARWDDGGTAARAACDAALKLADVDLLLSAMSNRLYDIKLHCLDCLAQLGPAEQRAGLARILRDDALWVKEQKIGELIVSQDRFAAKVQAMAARWLPADAALGDLFDPATRQRIAAALAARP